MRLAGVKAVKKRKKNKLGGLKRLSVVRKHMMTRFFSRATYDTPIFIYDLKWESSRKEILKGESKESLVP
jgi:hypothetical protein